MIVNAGYITALGASVAAFGGGIAVVTVAVSAGLLFRLATFWLPVPIGWLTYTWMQRHGWL